jgi:transposase
VSEVAADLGCDWHTVMDAVNWHGRALIDDPNRIRATIAVVLDEVRRRVQNDTLGHRRRKSDPLYRSRKLMTLAHERLDDAANAKLVGLLEAGHPRGEVRNAWHAKEVVRSIYAIDDAELATEFVTQLGIDLQDESCPPEIRRLGRTITKWRHQIAAWHQAKFTNGPTEAINNLIKRVKRVAIGITKWTNYRTRSLLYAGKPNWSLLDITPR